MAGHTGAKPAEHSGEQAPERIGRENSRRSLPRQRITALAGNLCADAPANAREQYVTADKRHTSPSTSRTGVAAASARDARSERPLLTRTVELHTETAAKRRSDARPACIAQRCTAARSVRVHGHNARVARHARHTQRPVSRGVFALRPVRVRAWAMVRVRVRRRPCRRRRFGAPRLAAAPAGGRRLTLTLTLVHALTLTGLREPDGERDLLLNPKLNPPSSRNPNCAG